MTLLAPWLPQTGGWPSPTRIVITGNGGASSGHGVWQSLTITSRSIAGALRSTNQRMPSRMSVPPPPYNSTGAAVKTFFTLCTAASQQATITSEAADYAAEVAWTCAVAGLRVAIDAGSEKINYKVREHSLAKVPVMLVVGRREAANRSVALRRLGGNDQEALALGEAVARLKEEAAIRPLKPFNPVVDGAYQPLRGDCT